MHRSRSASFVLALTFTLLLLALSAAAAPPGAAAQGPQLPAITLKSRTIKPTFGVDAATGAQLDRADADAKAKAASVHALVQLDHIPDPAEKAALAARGIHLQNYLPQQAWVARIEASAGKASALVGKDGVAWVGALLPADKVNPNLAADVEKPTADKDTPLVPVIVQFHDDVSLAVGRAVLARLGARITNESSAINAVTVVMKPSDVKTLSQQEEVLWLESPLPPLTATNSNTRARTNVDQVQNVAPYNLNGAGVNVLVYDVGRASHEDFNGRIVDQDGTSVADHSTHVAGTVLGNGSGAATSVLNNRGMAPSAGLITYGYEDDGSNLFFYDNLGDIQADMQNGLNHNANIATASLGTNLASNGTSNINNGQPVGVFNCNREGDYGAGSQLLDQIVRGSLGRSLIMTWANGNERGDGRCGTQFSTTAPPATAKNPIQVGATQQGNDSSAGFSGWGPTDDGRLKPIVSAPGVSVLSTIPNVFIDNTNRNCNGTGDDFCWPYDTMSGTSMATPAVAGISALMVQQFHNSYSTTHDPLPATVKAILMNTAASPSGGNGPDFRTGYGRVDARAAVDTIRENRFVEGRLASNGEVQRYHLNVPPGAPLQVSVAWDDAAGTLLAATELVNDLDLRLIAPDGVTTWQPWVLDPANPANAATRGNDTLNNQEMVTVPSPAAGWWTVEVRATSLPQGPQTYGLAATQNPWSFNIAYPLTGAVADAGWFNGPGTFPIHLDVSDGYKPSTNLVTNLADPNALKLFVGPKQIDTGAGVGEGGVIQRGPVGNQYWLVVRAPSQAAAGLYDFRVDVLGALTKTETNAVRYSNTPTPPRALSVVIDTSGSMADYAQMPAAKDAARSIIMGTEIGEGVAETQFNTNASLVQALLNVTAPGDRNAMAGNLAGLTPAGSTALGQGITQGYSQISGDSRTHAMVLLSDGMENTPPMYNDIKTSIPTDVRLDTIALGPLADQALMARIAGDHPGSTPWYVPTGPGAAKSSGEGSDKLDSVASDVSVATRVENRLTDVYHFIDNYQRRYQRLFEAAGQLNGGGSTTLSVSLNENARFLYFTVNWADPTVTLNFVLRRPDGTTVPTGNPDIYRVDSVPGGASKRYRIAAPAAGLWKMELSNPGADGTEFLATVEGQVDTDLTLFTPSLGQCRPTTPNKVCISFNDEKGNIKGGRFEYLRARLSDGKQVQLVDREGTGLYCSEDLRFEQPGMQSFKVEAMAQNRNGQWVRRVQRADFYCGPLDLPPVLLVNDAPSLERGGQYYPVRDMYVAALNTIGAQFRVWNTDDDGIPSGAALSQYEKVIWLTGTRKADPRHPPLPLEAEKAVRRFLEARQGNTFALSSQDYLSVNGVTDFGKEVLGVAAFDNDTRGTTMRGLRASPLGHEFGAFPYGPPYTNLADVVRPMPDAAANMVDETGRVTGVTHGYGEGCAAFFSFGLEGLPPGAFQDMLKRFLAWDCAPVALNTTATPQDVTLHYGEVYSTTFQIQNPLVGPLHVELNNGPTHLALLTDGAGGIPTLLAPYNVGDLPDPPAAKSAPSATAAAGTPLDPSQVLSRLCWAAGGLADCFGPGMVSVPRLLDNDIVVVWNDTPLGDPDRVGDILADFVDHGGTVLLGGNAIQAGAAGIGGRWAAEGYSPLATTGAPKGAATLGAIGDPADPLFAGVAALTTTRHVDAEGQGNADVRAKWSDGNALLATRSFQPGVGPQVIAVNASFANGQWGGNLQKLVANALGALDMTWRRPGWFRLICSVASPPIDGKVGAIPPIVFDGSASCPDVQGGVSWQVKLVMDSRFTPADAFGGPNPPHYQGKLTIDTNAMGQGRVAIPLGMTVLPAEVTPTPTATPTETVAAADTATPTPTPTETVVPADTATPTPTPTETVAPADTATPTATATPTTMVPADTPTVTPTATDEPVYERPYKIYLPHVMRAP